MATFGIFLSTCILIFVEAYPEIKNISHPEPLIGKVSDQDSCKMMTLSGHPCVLPFTYKGGSFTNCTNVDHPGMKWCSLTANYDTDGQWSKCTAVHCDNCKVHTVEGHTCRLPFGYKGVTYQYCTDVEHNRPWCADDVGRWGNCGPSHCGECIVRSDTWGLCVFPFTYKNVWYTYCTLVDSKLPWCSYTTYYSGQWGFCKHTECTAT